MTYQELKEAFFLIGALIGLIWCIKEMVVAGKELWDGRRQKP